MNLFWLIGGAVVIFFIVLVLAAITAGNDKNETFSSVFTAAFLASILFVLIMIYDKL